MTWTRRKFQYPAMAQVYETLLSLSEEELEPDVVRARGATGEAYWRGRWQPEAPRPRRGTMAYAAWAAGVDRRRDDEREARAAARRSKRP